MRMSSSRLVMPLTLTVGESVTFSVFRLFPDTVRISLDFDRKHGLRRLELGEYTMTRGPNYIQFRAPGEPVILQVQSPTANAEYEAMPAGAHSHKRISRELVVRESDDNPNRFTWPPDNVARLTLPVGSSEITLRVLEVGTTLASEKVDVVIEPPLSFKSAMPGYSFLWWFFFWPLLSIPLAVYAGYLLWQGRNKATQ